MRLPHRTLLAATALAMPLTTTAVATAGPGTHPVASTTSKVATRYCHGRRATIVGKPGRYLYGTEGDDVIVTHEATRVYGRTGDDLICVTRGSGPMTQVLAGPGDDVVDASASRVGASVGLGLGDDVFVGSPYDDSVGAAGDGTDRLFTGGGADWVVAGGRKGHHDHDLVRLGSGDDEVLDGLRDPTTRYYGGGGTDTLDLPYDGPGAQIKHDWVYDNVRHGTFRNGDRVQWFSGFDRFKISGSPTAAAAHSMRFVGGPGPEQLVVYGLEVPLPVRLNLGGGSDVVEISLVSYLPDEPKLQFVLTGGPGRDLFRPIGGAGFNDGGNVVSSPFLGVDLPGDVFTIHRGQRPTGTIKGFEDVDASNYAVADLRGDELDNSLVSKQSCQGELLGAGGNDVLAVGAYDTTGDCDRGQPGPVAGATLDGGPGDDALVGGYADDTLTGGDGTDSADGGPGLDTCSAETITNCEAP